MLCQTCSEALLSTLKIYPEILFRAIHRNKPVGAFRVWFIAKDFDIGGCGFIPAKAFRQHLRALGIPKQTLYRWLEQAGRLGLITWQDKVYRLTSWQNGAIAAGVSRLARAVLIPKERFLSKGRLAWCWAGIILHHKGMISRAALEALSGVPARTQLEYEKKAGVQNKANYASYGRPENNPEVAIGVIDLPGHYGKGGEVRRRLPNSREVSEVSLANKGRLKQINRALYSVRAASSLNAIEVFQANAHHMGGELSRIALMHNARALYNIEDSSPCGTLGEIGDHQMIYKLYSLNWRETKRAMRARRKRDGDARCRPAFIFERARDWRGVGVFFAIRL